MACYLKLCAALALTVLVVSALEMETGEAAALRMSDLLKSVMRESNSRKELHHSNVQQHRQRGGVQDYHALSPTPTLPTAVARQQHRQRGGVHSLSTTPTLPTEARRRLSLSRELEAILEAMFQQDNETGAYNSTENEDEKDSTPKEDTKEKSGGNPNTKDKTGDKSNGEKSKHPCNHDRSTTEEPGSTTTEPMTTTTRAPPPPLYDVYGRRKMSSFQQEEEEEQIAYVKTPTNKHPVIFYSTQRGRLYVMQHCS